MECYNCGNYNRGHSRYCDQCGSMLEARPGKQPSRHPWKVVSTLLLLVYPIMLVVVSLVNMLVPRRAGVLALTEVFAPYLFLPLLLLVPFAFLRRGKALKVALVACGLLFLLRFPPALASSAPVSDAGGLSISAMNWNVRTGGQADKIRPVLMSKPAAIVGLVETDWNWLRDDTELRQIYPYQLASPGKAAPGNALLSSYPIISSGILDTPKELWGRPQVMWARLEVGLGQTLTVVVAHPPPGNTCGSRGPFPHCYDTALRDKRLQRIREFIQPSLDRGESVLLMGDFNVTEREPAYKDLATGLQDLHKMVGSGAGHTWRPPQFMSLDMAMLRIDYQLTSPNIMPLSSSVDCTPRGSDHCIVVGHYLLK